MKGARAKIIGVRTKVLTPQICREVKKGQSASSELWDERGQNQSSDPINLPGNI